MNEIQELHKRIDLVEKGVNESILLIGIKISALKATLNSSQTNDYNNYIIDFIEQHKEKLEKALTPEKFQELRSYALG